MAVYYYLVCDNNPTLITPPSSVNPYYLAISNSKVKI